MTGPSTHGVRLAELVASLSLATDLGLGQPQEHVLRQTIIASRLASLARLTEVEQAATFYVSLLAWVGCVADSQELSRWFEDDTGLRAASFAVDRAGMPMLRFLIGNLASDGSPLDRLSTAGRFLTGGLGEVMRAMSTHCEATAHIADRLGLAESVRRALPQVLERWDGKGAPAGLRGDQLEPVMRVAQIANESEVFHRVGGVPGVVTMLSNRRGTQFDPRLVDLTVAHADELFARLDEIDAWAAVIHGCAALDREMTDPELRTALQTLADYADVRSSWFLGHSRSLAGLAAGAARRRQLPGAQVELVELAGLVSRLGTIGVSARTWNRAGPLSTAERERVRTVPYLTERILRHQPSLAEVGTIAGMVYERLDGSGYPRGLAGAAIPPAARILAAAAVYQALSEARAYRPAVDPEHARRQMLAEATAGRIDGDAVNAVLAAAGHRVRHRPANVAGLTAREVEILAMVVRGLPNREVAATLSISPRTVGSHIEHIYNKIGVTSRGAAALFTMRHGLVDAVALDDEAYPAAG